MVSLSNIQQFILANTELLKIQLVCKIIDVDQNIDSCVCKGNQQKITYLNTELDFCVYLEGVAYNDFDDIKLIIRSSFGNDREAHMKYLDLCKELCKDSEAILLSASVYTLVENELALYDPDIEALGFSYDEIN